MYEYKTACFYLNQVSRGGPLKDVDEAIALMQAEGWEFDQLSSSATIAALAVVLVFRRKKE